MFIQNKYLKDELRVEISTFKTSCWDNHDKT